MFVSTAQKFDGCDSGASPDEAVSWGKIRANAEPVKVFDIKNYFSCQGYITIINVRNLDI